MRCVWTTLLVAFFAVAALPWELAADDVPLNQQYDLVVYGGTSGGVAAAVQAKRMGKSAIVIEPSQHLGGLSSGGLGFTDTGNKAVIGGLARQFYHRVWQHYDGEDAWVWQDKASYGNRGQGHAAIDQGERTMWIFEPSVAESIFDGWVKEHEIPVIRNGWLNRETGVAKDGTKITAITLLDGRTIRGKMFIDATYEGDLLAAAGVSYHVGRESNETYGETWNGVQTGVFHHRHHFKVLPKPISPYRVADDPTSGLLPRISPDPPGEKGSGDHRVQAYCFRMCLTNHPENRVPFPKPDGYDADQYLLLLRIFDAGWRETFHKFDPVPNRKTDTNNHGPFSTDNIGYNYDYPEATYERRREIIAEHETYQQGLMYFLANDERVPEEVRTRMSQWGLAKDEFVDNGHWPHQLYIREARRMVGAYVMTENELLKRRPTPDSVGMGSYTIDSHNVQRYVTEEGHVHNEGDIGVGTPGPYEIAYGALVPQAEECTNLLVPVCVSSSHIAFGSIRMEPVFMILGQSAATAAALAIDADISVQDVPYETLREKLLEDGQVLEHGDSRQQSSRGVDPKTLDGIVVDDAAAKKVGDWQPSFSQGRWVGNGYLHDNNEGKGQRHVRFTAEVPKAGEYEVRLAYSGFSNRASNVPVTVSTAAGDITKQVDQRRQPPIDGLWVSLGTHPLAAGEVSITVSNAGTDGHVIADAVQLLPK